MKFFSFFYLSLLLSKQEVKRKTRDFSLSLLSFSLLSQRKAQRKALPPLLRFSLNTHCAPKGKKKSGKERNKNLTRVPLTELELHFGVRVLREQPRLEGGPFVAVDDEKKVKQKTLSTLDEEIKKSIENDATTSIFALSSSTASSSVAVPGRGPPRRSLRRSDRRGAGRLRRRRRGLAQGVGHRLGRRGGDRDRLGQGRRRA